METVTLSPGETGQLDLPVHLVRAVSDAGSSSYQAPYWSPATELLGVEFSETPAWMRSDEVYPPMPVQVAANPGGTDPAVGTTKVDFTAVIPSLEGVTAYPDQLRLSTVPPCRGNVAPLWVGMRAPW